MSILLFVRINTIYDDNNDNYKYLKDYDCNDNMKAYSTIKYIFNILFMLSFLIIPVNADWKNVSSDDDEYFQDVRVNEANPTTNQDGGNLQVQSYNGVTGNMRQWFRLNISGIEGKQIDTAFLNLYHINSYGTRTITEWFVSNNSWVENTITYANRPSGTSTIRNFEYVGTGTADYWQTIDITDVVQYCANNATQYCSFYWRDSVESSSTQYYQIWENYDDAGTHNPSYNISYSNFTDEEINYNGTNNIIFSNTTDYTKNITSHPINTKLFITTFLNNSLWDSWWVRNFATLNYIVPSGESYNIGYIIQQNASQYNIIPDQNGIYTFTVRCDFFCGVFDYYTIFSEDINIIYPYNEPDDLLFSHTLDYNTSITEHPLNESFYLNVWIADGSSMSESDYFGHWRINVTSPTDTYLGTYYPVRNYYQGSYPIQISMDQFNGTGKYGNYTFKMFFALTPDEMNTGEVLIKEAVIYLYNVSNYNDTGYYNNITEELGDVPDSDISNYTDIPELQFLNNSFSYDTFVWIATPIHTMHIGIDSINNYYSDTNNTQHITVLGSIVPILVSNLPEKVKLLFTYQIILTIILLIMGRD